MRELKLSQSFSMITLNAQDSVNMTMTKKASLRCIAAAIILETYLDGAFINLDGKLSLKKLYLDNPNITLYQEVIFKRFFNRKKEITEDLSWWLSKASNLSTKYLKEVEKAITDSLIGYDYMEEIPSLLNCDMLYKTSGLELKEYRSNIDEYSRISEVLKAEILEDGSISDESLIILWLLRESGCIQDIFSISDSEIIDKKICNLHIYNNFWKKLFEIHISHSFEIATKKLLEIKKNAIKTPLGIGINFIYPEIERSQAIFIDTEEWFPNAKSRLEAVIRRLNEGHHNYVIIKEGDVPIIKIDNTIYEVIPHMEQYRGASIHGVRLRKYPI